MLPHHLSIAFLCAGLALQPCSAHQDKPQEKLGPKNEPAAMGSDYQPLLWSGSDAAFALDTVRFGACQIESSGLVATKSSNPDLQQIATRSVDLQQHSIKKLRSMAKVIEFKFPSKKQVVSCSEAGDLAARSGADFETSYLAFLSKSNSADMARYKAEAEALPDSANFDLQKFAAATLPALTEQQKSIDALKRKLAGAEGATKPAPNPKP